MRWRVLLSLTLVAGLAVTSSLAADDSGPKSGAREGQVLPGPFQVFALNGDHKGKYHCLVCEFELNPTALVFGRAPDPEVGKLAKKLDETITRDQNAFLRGGVVFLASPENEKERNDLETKINDWLKANEVPHLAVGTMESAGPKDYELGREDEVTVILYTRLRVVKRVAFKRGMLTDKDVDTIVEEFAKLSPQKK
jgi:hypothetical protein